MSARWRRRGTRWRGHDRAPDAGPTPQPRGRRPSGALRAAHARSAGLPWEQALSRLARAAELLGLDDGMHEMLRAPLGVQAVVDTHLARGLFP